MNATWIGITGNSGAGKSAVADWMAQWGAEVVDADAIGHQLLLPGSGVFNEVVERYGDGVLDSEGRIDRCRLGSKVFANSEETARYNEMIHPALIEEIRRQMREKSKLAEIVVLDAALLFEWSLDSEMNHVVTIVASNETRRKRIAVRDGGSSDRFMDREAAQWPQEKKANQSDSVINNDSDWNEFEKNTKTIWRNIRG
jgi:dephospho-CoA kinase